MNKRKIIYSGLLLILVVAVLYVYNSFNGNPFSKYMATKEVKNYVTEQYPDKELRVAKGFYDFKFGEYTFDVIEIGEGDTYKFSAQGFIFPEVAFDGIYYANLDQPLMEKLRGEASEEMTALFSDQPGVVRNIHVQIEVLKGTYAPEVSWSKDLVVEKPLYVHMYVDATRATKEEILETTQMIQTRLNKEGYDYDRVTINGNVLDELEYDKDGLGYVKYAVSFGKDTELRLRDVKEYK